MDGQVYRLRLRLGEREFEVAGDREWVESFWENPAIRGHFLEAEGGGVADLQPSDFEPAPLRVRTSIAGATRRRAPGAGSAGRKRRVQKLIEPPREIDRFTAAIRASADHKARVFLSLLLARELYKLEGLSMAEILQVLNGRCGLRLHRSSLDASLKRVESGFEKVRPRWSNQIRLYRLTADGEREAQMYLNVAETPVPTAAETAQLAATPLFLESEPN